MPFPKNNDYAYKPSGDEALDPSPLCLKVKVGVKTKLKTIPRWQERLRRYIDEMIAESTINEDR